MTLNLINITAQLYFSIKCALETGSSYEENFRFVGLYGKWDFIFYIAIVSVAGLSSLLLLAGQMAQIAVLCAISSIPFIGCLAAMLYHFFWQMYRNSSFDYTMFDGSDGTYYDEKLLANKALVSLNLISLTFPLFFLLSGVLSCLYITNDIWNAATDELVLRQALQETLPINNNQSAADKQASPIESVGILHPVANSLQKICKPPSKAVRVTKVTRTQTETQCVAAIHPYPPANVAARHPHQASCDVSCSESDNESVWSTYEDFCRSMNRPGRVHFTPTQFQVAPVASGFRRGNKIAPSGGSVRSDPPSYATLPHTHR